MTARKTMVCIALVIIISILTFASGCIYGFGPTVTGSGKLASWDFDLPVKIALSNSVSSAALSNHKQGLKNILSWESIPLIFLLNQEASTFRSNGNVLKMARLISTWCNIQRESNFHFMMSRSCGVRRYENRRERYGPLIRIRKWSLI